MTNQPYYPPPYYTPPPPPYAAPPQTSTLAVVSLISGILGWLGLFGLGGIVAIITGHMAKGQIRDSMGRLTGDGMATFGLILGYANIILACCGILVALAFWIILPLMGIAVSPYFQQ